MFRLFLFEKFHFKTVPLLLFIKVMQKKTQTYYITPPTLCCTCNASLSPNVVHSPPWRHPLIQHRWQVAKLNWRQNFPKYIITPQAWQGEPSVLFKCSFVLRKMMRSKSGDAWFLTQRVRKRENKSNQASVMLHIYVWEKKKMSRTEHAWTLRILHSDSTSGCMINSLACRELGDKYAALRNTFCWLWHTQKSVDG